MALVEDGCWENLLRAPDFCVGTGDRLDLLPCLLAAEAKHGTLVLVLAYTGLRWDEVTAFRVKDVNPMRRRLNVVLNAVEVGGNIELGTPKTHKKRTVPFPAFLADALVAQMAGKHPEDLLFPGSDGKYMKRGGASQTSNRWFANALLRAGLERMTVHDLRHTAASLAISAGANVKSVQAMLGHTSATMTLDTYADLFPDDLDAVAVALDAAASQQVAHKVRSQD
ncbi:site-specific integrase [Paenarthrobacter sp. NPDC089316]|uniref:tyrosine-type recombinase/integrase n=1 Tax=unclassified Paenarthrobacter TaxID=2634190 RepID=UPI003428A40D